MNLLRCRRWLLACALLAVVVSPAGVLTALAAEERSPDALASLREELRGVNAALERVEARSDSLRARAEQVSIELAALEREESLGPVKRAQLSAFRQESQRLADSRTSLERDRATLERRYGSIAQRLLPLLTPAIDRARAAYQAQPEDSQARAELFRRFEQLVLERKALEALSPPGAYLFLDIRIERDDSVQDLRDKANLAADNRDLLALKLSSLSGWKRDLIVDRAVLADWRKLREENEFFMQTDPVAPSYIRDLPPGLGAGDVVPRDLHDLAHRLTIPPGGPSTEEDYDRLIESIGRVEAELEDEILAMSENQKIIEAEIERRGGLE